MKSDLLKKAILINPMLVILGIAISLILFLPFSNIWQQESLITEILYILIIGIINNFIPFLIFFDLYELVRRYLLKKNFIKTKFFELILLGFGCMVLTMGMIIVFTVTSGLNLVSLKSLIIFLKDFTLFAIFIPVIVSLDFYYLTRKKIDDR